MSSPAAETQDSWGEFSLRKPSLAAGAAVITTAAVCLLIPSPAAGAVVGIATGLLVAWLILLRHERAYRAEIAALESEVNSLDGVLREARLTRDPLEDRSASRDLEQLRERLSVRALDLARRAGQVRGELETLRGIVDAVDIPVFATTPSGHLVLCNPAFERLLERPRGAVVGLSIEEVLPQTPLLEVLEHAQAGAADQAQISLRTPVGERVFQVSAVPTRGPGNPHGGVVVALRDVTELAEAVRLKTDFVANASHELRTPIASIRAAVETLGAASDDPAMIQRLTKMIAGAVERLEEMIADLLDLSRLEQPDLEPTIEEVDLADVVAQLTAMLETPCQERGLRIEADLHPAFARLRTDPHLITLILRNLVENATKFAHEGTAIRVVARPLPPEGDGLAGARIDVVDRGIGIPLKLQQRVFERFYQVDPSRTRQQTRRGTGLGLAIVKHAVRQLGGDIAVESVWQEGTTMSVTLPNALPREAAGDAPAAATGAAGPRPDPGAAPGAAPSA